MHIRLKRNGKFKLIECEDEIDLIDWYKEGWEIANSFENIEEARKADAQFQAKNQPHPEDYDIDIYFPNPYHKQGTGFGNVWHMMQKFMLSRHRIYLNPNFHGQEVGLYYMQPHHIESLNLPLTDKKIIYTMFESSKPPVEWRMPLRKADMVMVPSEWCKGIFDDSYDIDTVVWGHGIDMSKTPLHFRKRSKRIGKPFVILHYDAQPRKGFQVLIRAFQKAFPKDITDVRLVLKGSKFNKDITINDDRIIFIERKYSRKEMNELLRIADIFAFPSYGEGFGIPPLEAMASGLPVIIPKAHSLKYYVDGKIKLGVLFTETYPVPAFYKEWEGDMGYYEQTSISSLKGQLLHAYERWNRKMSPFQTFYQSSMAGYVYRKWDATVTTDKLYDILKERNFV